MTSLISCLSLLTSTLSPDTPKAALRAYKLFVNDQHAASLLIVPWHPPCIYSKGWKDWAAPER